MKKENIKKAIRYLEDECDWNILQGDKLTLRHEGVRQFILACKIAIGRRRSRIKT